jgi:hypothetical protein
MEGKIPSLLARIWNDSGKSFKKIKHEKNTIILHTTDFDFVL